MEVFRVSSSIYKKLFISFIVTITTLILLLSSILYYNYSSSSITMLKELKAEILHKTSYSAIYMDSLANKFCQSLFLNNSIIAFANSNHNDILITSKAIQTLSSLSSPNTYIKSAYIYNRKIDTFISTPSNTFYNSSDFFDKEIIQMLNETESYSFPTLYPIPRTAANPVGANQPFSNVYTYVLFDTNNDNWKNFNNAIILNVDADWLRTMISSIDKMDNDGSEFLVANESGVIVNHSSPDQFLKNIADQGYFQKISSSTSSSGTFIENLDGKKYFISYVLSEELGWTFISMTPYKSVFAPIQRNGTITIVFCMVVLLLGLFYAYLASKKLYRPIGALTNDIKQKLNPDTRSDKGMDEMAFIKNAFKGILDKTVDLENMKRNNALLLKNEYLKNVLNGQVSPPQGQLPADRKEFDLDLNFNHELFMYVLKLDYYRDFIEKFSETDRSLYKYAIANIAKEITAKYFNNETIDTAPDQLVILADINSFEGNMDELYASFHTLVAQIQNYIKQSLKLSVTGTLGYKIETPEQLKSVYTKTLHLSMYRIKYGHSSIITPSILQDVESGSNFKFPTSKEKQLINELMLGHGNEAKDTYREIIKKIECTNTDNILTSVIYLFSSIFNSLNQIVADAPSQFNDMTIQILHKVTGLETLDEMQEAFFEMIDKVIEIKNSSKDRKKTEIVTRTIEYIQENYRDKNLSLNSCAEMLSLSSVYLGKIFKNSTGKSVAEYITLIRMENLKYYLEQNNMPINDILDLCGIEKSNYFYTTFKKYFGVSLSEYKLTILKNREE
ncbi:helix-turn-helix domain-containing protein [Paenibacillus macquariensis]|uniref:Cache domain-containing protein n=1 Tax=Paenibacillus macquariensis TaxID=948756 RepID=A0ABY1KB27_9BACL|nr:helix-turn-helix domain-containing protein [Paenibacillus macquariensis]MEC0089532.1 AraC family transcriptional regulator [Paenibacillus macquariensis]OAB25797.1 hypothetical protein PMSM_27900 [Paenibacillus macquariensis subsp. macquariensis]SIR53353.1 Cache domain-containing protein [Paenibacillus macquariensis]